MSGDEKFYRREWQAAVKAYEEAILKFPEHEISRYQYLVGTIEVREENYVAGFNRFQNAISIEPAFVDSYVELGVLLL